jgi:transposase
METKTKRRIFDEAFKREAVGLLLKGDQPIKALAADLGVSHWNLRDWKKHYSPPTPVRSSEALEIELRALRRENERLRAQRDI